MFQTDRRSFLKVLAATLAAAPLHGVLAHESTAYSMLVIGDSLIWGQGLLEKDKTYTHVAEWLRGEAFAVPRSVDVKVKAHSGANIRFDTKEAAKYRAAGKDENHYYPGEMNLSTPSMWKQVETAAEEFRAAGRARGADLVLLTAGITDITVEGVLDPFGDNSKLPAEIDKVCRVRVAELLGHVAAHNPDSLIVVPGYFPMLSPKSSRSKVFNGWLEVSKVPGVVQSIANNGVVRPLLFGRLFKKAVKRSQIWKTESDKALNLAVESLNAKSGRRQAIFVPAPLTEDHAAETPDTKLFRMRRNGTTTDPLYESRKADCEVTFEELERTTGIKKSSRRCSVAGVGHPDEAGARMYGDAIIAALGSLLPR